MKDSAWYNKLWQSKMQELPLQGDGHDAWQKMQGLLDQHMPVNSTVIAPKAATTVWVKLMYLLAVIISAAILYYGATHILVYHHEKTNKSTGKHAHIITDSAANKSGLTTTGTPTDNAAYSKKNTAIGNINKNNGIQNLSNASLTTGKSPSANNTNIGAANNVNKADVKHTTSNTAISNTKSSGINNQIAGGNHTRRNSVINHLAAGRNSGALTTFRAGLYNPGLLRETSQNHPASHFHSKTTNQDTTTSKNDQQLLADQNSIKTNDAVPSNTGNPVGGAGTNGTTQNVNSTSLSVKTDSHTVANNVTAKQIADAEVKNQSNKSASKSKPSVSKKPTDSKFTIDVKLGANTNKGSNMNPFLGIMGNYRLHNKWGISIGANVLSTRIISGSYGKGNLNYITIGDSSKKITHNSGQLTINGTRKIVYVDVPILITYKLSNKFTIKAGPVISIPIKTEPNKNTLGPLSSSADTTTLRTVTPYVNSTTINSKVNFSFSAGAQYTIKRFYFDATYLQGLSPYTIGSGLGSGKIYYHTIQIGIGYHLFKSKSK